MNGKIDSLNALKGSCRRCGRSYSGPFPYCSECGECPACSGNRFEIVELEGKQRRRACSKCEGRGWVFLTSESQKEFFARLF